MSVRRLVELADSGGTAEAPRPRGSGRSGRPWLLPRSVDIRRRGIISAGRYGFEVALPELAGLADHDGAPRRSPVRLLEAGCDLGPRHTQHNEIRSVGGGAFSHWNDTLYFSASDNTSAIDNGRRYTVHVPSVLSERLRALLMPRRLALSRHWMIAQGGQACAIALPAFRATADDGPSPARSALRVFEDGIEIGPAHAAHDRITEPGGGCFSHWQDDLLFSSTDGSSPITNGRQYTAFMPSRLSLALCWLRDLLASRRYVLAPHYMAPEWGHSFAISLPELAGLSDGLENGERSPLRVFEDGREIGPAHTAHKRIALLGLGRFSHWGDRILLSSSDGRSPRDVGRHYVAVVPSPLRRWAAQSLGKVSSWARTSLRRVIQAALARTLPRAGSDDTLFYFYDLQELPLTYDVVHHLVIAEFERRRRRLRTLHLVLVPGEWNGRHDDGYCDVVPPEATALRLYQLALPIAGLLGSCRGVTLCASRDEAEWVRYALARHVFPLGYSPASSPSAAVDITAGRSPKAPADAVFPLLRANAEACRAAESFLRERVGDRRPVVITIRHYAFEQERNSRVADWIAFADALDPERYAAVFVPDTAGSLGALDPGIRRHVVCETASWNVHLRMALYEAAHVNMAHMGGPLELALYNGCCRYVVFIPVDSSDPLRADVLTATGFVIGRDLPFARPGQRIVWGRDELPAILQAFSEFDTQDR